MNNLQDLYDFYIKINSSSGKISSATTLLIHICKALNFDMTEQITKEYYAEIPSSLDDFYRISPHKAIQDKSILAEMIGRYGPRDGWEKIVEIMLEEKDENLRQFALHSLEYYGHKHPESIIPYLKQYIFTTNEIMKQISAHVFAAFLCDKDQKSMEIVIDEIKSIKSQDFLNEIYIAMLEFKKSPEIFVSPEVCIKQISWMEDNILK